jgi:cell division protein FtsQ
MINKIATLLLAALLSGYILFSILSPKKQPDEARCRNVQIVIADTLDKAFISPLQVTAILADAQLHPTGKPLKDIRTADMEAKLQENPFVKEAQVYKTPSGIVKIKLYQRTPLLRVMSAGENYFIDSEGKIIPAALRVAAYVPVVTGHVDRKFAQSKLYDLACFLHDNKFWAMQIQQIHVHPNHDIELTPRIGNHQILLGKITGFEEKLEHLRLFYQQALNNVGWNRYSKINLKYKNQIVCTKNS